MALARCPLTIQDESGNVINGATVEVRSELDVGLPLASLYSDRAGATPLGNPFTAADGADAGFHVSGGSYKITATKGAFARTWRYVAVGLASESDSATGGQTSVFPIVAFGVTEYPDDAEEGEMYVVAPTGVDPELDGFENYRIVKTASDWEELEPTNYEMVVVIGSGVHHFWNGSAWVEIGSTIELDLTTSEDKHEFREAIGAAPAAHGNVLCEHKGLKVKWTGNTGVDVNADWLVLLNSNGSGERVGPIDLSLAITTAGANGLDTGSEGSSRFYHLHIFSSITPIAAAANTSTSSSKLIDSGADFTTAAVKAGDVVRNLTDGTEASVTAVDSATQLALSANIFTGTGKNYEVIAVCGVFSESVTAPTPPAGYTHKGYVGSVYNNSSSNFLPFLQVGNFVQPQAAANAVSSGSASTYTSVDCSAIVPSTATVLVLGAVPFTSSGTALVDVFMAPHGSGTSPTYGFVRLGDNNCKPSPDFNFTAPALVAMETPQTFYYYVTGTNALVSIQVRGYYY